MTQIYFNLIKTGNMWSQTWSNIYDLCVPYPGKSSPDITPELVRQVRVKAKLSTYFFF